MPKLPANKQLRRQKMSCRPPTQTLMDSEQTLQKKRDPDPQPVTLATQTSEEDATSITRDDGELHSVCRTDAS